MAYCTFKQSKILSYSDTDTNHYNRIYSEADEILKKRKVDAVFFLTDFAVSICCCDTCFYG